MTRLLILLTLLAGPSLAMADENLVNSFKVKTIHWICPKHGDVGQTYDLLISTFTKIRFESDKPEVFRCPMCYWDALKEQCLILKKEVRP